MQWKQFFTPIESFDANEARDFITQNAADSVTILDVRQPREYEASHIPGAKLIPLPDLNARLDEIPPGKPTVVY